MDAKTLDALTNMIESVRPEAKELVELALKDKSTKDGYGKVLTAVSYFAKDKPIVGKIFLLACVKEGYPQTTADQISQIMGW